MLTGAFPSAHRCLEFPVTPALEFVFELVLVGLAVTRDGYPGSNEDVKGLEFGRGQCLVEHEECQEPVRGWLAAITDRAQHRFPNTVHLFGMACVRQPCVAGRVSWYGPQVWSGPAGARTALMPGVRESGQKQPRASAPCTVRWIGEP